jgi:hypothetical protein
MHTLASGPELRAVKFGYENGTENGTITLKWV